MEVRLTINGDNFKFATSPDEYLVETLRKLGFKSVKKGCDTASCGVCNIEVDGKLVPSCSYLTVRADGMNITTVEGIGEEVRMYADKMTSEGAEQCGFCSPGHMMALHVLFLENPDPSLDEVKHFMAGNLCRCTGYEGQHRAYAKILEVRASGSK